MPMFPFSSACCSSFCRSITITGCKVWFAPRSTKPWGVLKEIPIGRASATDLA